MSIKICIINGPNLNFLGLRQPEIYGNESLDSINQNLIKKFEEVSFTFFQSNNENELISKIQNSGTDFDGLVINGGAFSHTSIAMADALASIKVPRISVHISNIFKREAYRHVDFISEKCDGAIIGLGNIGYELAVECILDKIKE